MMALAMPSSSVQLYFFPCMKKVTMPHTAEASPRQCSSIFLQAKAVSCRAEAILRY